jgi:hypothetical protein
MSDGFTGERPSELESSRHERFHHGHKPRAEEIALHQKYLTLEGQIDASRLEGDEAEVRRLAPLSEPRQAGSRPIGE